MPKFIGRKRELASLRKLLDLKKSSLIAIKGRRRVGKSRLLREFGNYFTDSYIFMGLAPEDGVTANDQRKQFANDLQKHFGVTGLKTDDWSDLFWHLAQQTKQGRLLIILDEVTWMAMQDPTFLPKLKNAWDLYFSRNDQLILALCSSISAWVEDNILSSTAFLGRISLTLTLRELPLKDCIEFWHNGGKGVSPQEQLTLLSVTGGIPRYLEEINPSRSAEWNIRQLCFVEGAVLYQEFDKIFSDLFSKRQVIYKKIVNCLVSGKLEIEEIRKKVDLSRGGDIYDYINDLEQAGFITRDYTWSIKTGKLSTLSLVRLSDNYTRFYLKYIKPNRAKIKTGAMEELSLGALPGWHSLIGLQVENLILANRALLKERLAIDANEIVYDNPYFQRQTNSKKGCQIDYMIQTRFNQLYIFEIKFSKHPVGLEIIDAMKEKINRLNIPRHFSYRPILIHCNTVTEQVEDERYFSDIIDFTNFLL